MGVSAEAGWATGRAGPETQEWRRSGPQHQEAGNKATETFDRPFQTTWLFTLVELFFILFFSFYPPLSFGNK